MENHFSWIEALRKPELQEELERYNLSSQGTVPILKMRLRNYLVYGIREGAEPACAPIVERLGRPLTPEIIVEVPQEVSATDVSVGNRIPPTSTGDMNHVNTPFRMPSPLVHISPPRASEPPRRYSEVPPRPSEHLNSPPMCCPQSRTMDTHAQIWVLEKVRSWNLKFDGRNEPEAFIERLFELHESYNIPEEHLFKALPELLVRDALTWYRNNRRLFHDWHSFLQEWSEYYLTSDYAQRLEQQILRTKQGIREKGRDFVSQMQTRMRRQGNFDKEREVAVIYSNLRPEYRQYIRKRDIPTISALIRQIDEYEQLQQELNFENKRFDSTHAPLVDSTRSNVKTEIRCYNCQELGHISSRCRQERKIPGNAKRTSAEGDSLVPVPP